MQESVRVERAATTPLQLDDVAAVEALVDLHLQPLERLRQPASRGRAVTHLEDFGDVPGHGVGTATLDQRTA